MCSENSTYDNRKNYHITPHLAHCALVLQSWVELELPNILYIEVFELFTPHIKAFS